MHRQKPYLTEITTIAADLRKNDYVPMIHLANIRIIL
jgi:hypothetical protein